MINHADLEKLRSMRAPEPAVLALYLPVDPAGVSGLAARAGGLRANAGADGPDGGSIAAALPDHGKRERYERGGR